MAETKGQVQRQIKYSEAIKEAIDQSMQRDKSIFIVGEGVPDPKGIFGTTLGLKEKYGDDRVMDMPISENGLTGICAGAAMVGMRPIITHQRMDFALISLDQIINNAAKWHYMFGGQLNVPMVIRMIIGRGWGQGAQHSQSLQALFAHIPGLKIVMPTTAYDAKGLLNASIEDNNPVIYIEHRWLNDLKDFVPEEYYITPIGKGKIIHAGKDITIASASYASIDAINAVNYLAKEGISAELIDIRSIKPLDEELILESVKKTGRLLVIDTGHYFCGFSAQIVAIVAEQAFSYLKYAPQRIALPDIPAPTSRQMANDYYPHIEDIINKIFVMLEQNKQVFLKKDTFYLDVPDKSFTGPF